MEACGAEGGAASPLGTEGKSNRNVEGDDYYDDGLMKMILLMGLMNGTMMKMMSEIVMMMVIMVGKVIMAKIITPFCLSW